MIIKEIFNDVKIDAIIIGKLEPDPRVKIEELDPWFKINHLAQHHKAILDIFVTISAIFWY